MVSELKRRQNVHDDDREKEEGRDRGGKGGTDRQCSLNKCM